VFQFENGLNEATQNAGVFRLGHLRQRGGKSNAYSDAYWNRRCEGKKGKGGGEKPVSPVEVAPISNALGDLSVGNVKEKEKKEKRQGTRKAIATKSIPFLPLWLDCDLSEQKKRRGRRENGGDSPGNPTDRPCSAAVKKRRRQRRTSLYLFYFRRTAATPRS